MTAVFPHSATRPVLPSGEGDVAVASVDATVTRSTRPKRGTAWNRNDYSFAGRRLPGIAQAGGGDEAVLDTAQEGHLEREALREHDHAAHRTRSVRPSTSMEVLRTASHRRRNAQKVAEISRSSSSRGSIFGLFGPKTRGRDCRFDECDSPNENWRRRPDLNRHELPDLLGNSGVLSGNVSKLCLRERQLCRASTDIFVAARVRALPARSSHKAGRPLRAGVAQWVSVLRWEGLARDIADTILCRGAILDGRSSGWMRRTGRLVRPDIRSWIPALLVFDAIPTDGEDPTAGAAARMEARTETHLSRRARANSATLSTSCAEVAICCAPPARATSRAPWPSGHTARTSTRVPAPRGSK